MIGNPQVIERATRFCHDNLLRSKSRTAASFDIEQCERHVSTSKDVAVALCNTVGVVAKFYSHKWAKARQGRTDAAIKAAWI